MTDQPRDDQFDRLLQGFLAWQAEDLVSPPTAAEVAMRIGSRTGPGGRRARVASVDTIPQQGTVVGRRWRLPTVPSALAKLAVSAVAVAAIVVVGLALMRPSVIGPGASASPTPLTTPQPSPSAGFSRFDSPLNGLSIDYPSGWQIRPATEPWTGGALDFDSPAADVIFDPALEGRVYFALASLPRADIIVNRPPDGGPFAGNESDLMQRAGMPCEGGGGGRFTVDGFRAFDWQCHGPASVGIMTPTRGYVIKLVVEKAGLLETYDLPSFAAILETVDLRPEEASDAPSASPPPTASPAPVEQPPSAFTERFDSPLHGLSISYPSGWQVRPATEPWAGGDLFYDSPAADVIFDPTLGDRLYLLLASEPLAGRSGDDWVASGALPQTCTGIVMGDGGHGMGSYALDGAHGYAVSMGCRRGTSGSRLAAVVATATRGYMIYLLNVVDEPGLAKTYDWDWFKAVLETVDLRPEDAVDASSPSSLP